MKISMKLVAATLAFGLTISLSACGSGFSASDLEPKPVKSLSEAKEKQAETAGKDAVSDKNSTDGSKDKDTDQKDSNATDGKLNPLLQRMIDEVNTHDITKTPDGEHLLSARAIGEAPGTLIYEYVLKPIPNPTSFASNMDELAPTDLAPIAKQIKKQMANAGIENPKIIYRYYLDDGKTVVWEGSF